MDARLVPIKDELEKVRSGLQALRGKNHSMDDLNPFQDQLRKLDGKREKGMFLVNGEIPKGGQAALAELIDDCYDLVEELTDTAQDADDAD